MKKICKLVLLALCLFITICIAGCTDKKQDDEFIKVIDVEGTEVTVSKDVSHVACISQSATDLMIAFGLGEKITGTYRSFLYNTWVTEIYPYAKNYKSYAYSVSAEELIADGIDLVIIQDTENAESFRNAGIPVIAVHQYSPTGAFDEEVYDTARIIGTIFPEAKEKADAWIKEVQDTIKDIESKVQKTEEKKTIYYVNGEKAKGLYYSNGQLIVGIIIGIIALLSVMLMYRLTNKDDKRVNAMKKRNMLRFYFTLIRELPVTFYYLIKMKKMTKKQELTFEEKYAFCQKILAKVNKLGNVYPVVVGLENVDKNATLYIVNHQGRYDGIGALSALKDFPCSFIADKKRICWPFYRELSTLLEAIGLELDNPRSEIKALQEMSEGLINGRSYLAFIEGKYEDNGNNLQEFKTGVLKTAYRAKVKITPVVLYDTYLVYGKSSIKKISPEIHFLKPIEYEEFAEINRKELADIIKEKMQNEINIINTRKGV